MTYKEHKQKRDQNIVLAYKTMVLNGFRSLTAIKQIAETNKIKWRSVYNVLNTANVQLKQKKL